MSLLPILEQYGVPYKLGGEHQHVTANFVGIDCPFCSAQSGKYKLGYNTSTGYTSCWSCGPLNLADALAEITGERKNVLQNLLAGVQRTHLPLVQTRGRLVVPSTLGILLPAHEAYLRRRGFDPDELVRLWGVRGIGISSQLSWRVWIPIHLHGEVVSWTSRSISDSAPVRYVSAKPTQERVSAKESLFGLDYVRHTVIVCEGPFDAMKIGPGAVATMGVNVTKAQIRLISVFPLRVVCFDNQVSAQIRAKKLCDDLSVFPGETINARIDAKDPASASGREIKALRRFLS